jgi:soluble lytic murein transglycosylase
MSARYDNPALVLAAYNAGPGQTDKWIQQYGDPRSGQISTQDWISKIPFSETQAYVTKGLHKLAAEAGQPNAPIQAPTANQLKTDLYARVQYARDVAEQQYPGDTAYADSVASRVESYGRMVIANQVGQQEAAHDTLIQGMIGSQPDGSDKPMTIDQLLANPQNKYAWNMATPEVKAAIQREFAGANQKLTQSGLNTYYELLGKRTNDPEAFADQTKTPLTSYFGQMPDHLLLDLINQQKAVNVNDLKQANAQLNWQQARSTVEDMLKPIGLGQSAKPNSQRAKTTEQFYGRLSEAMTDYHDANGKWPQTQDIRKMAGALLTQGAQSGGTFLDSDKRAFEVENQSQFYVPLPGGDQKSQLAQTFQKVMGHVPTEAELTQWYTRYKMSGGK